MLNFNRSEAAGGHYRPDIDGLRALAVLPVVLYHYRLPGFSGGFVGVDIFFVISGFLITSLIHAEMGEGRFSILRFYERRIRRIFPAIFALLAVVTVLALVLLFPRTGSFLSARLVEQSMPLDRAQLTSPIRVRRVLTAKLGHARSRLPAPTREIIR